MMTMKKILYTITAALLLAGCFHEFHEKSDGTGSVAAALRWEQPGDAGTPVHGLTCSIGGFTKVYASAEELASGFLQLPAGEYDILVTANMAASDGYVLDGLPATRADGVLPEVKASLKDPASNPAQAWFGVAHAHVKEGDVSIVDLALQRLLCTLTVNVANLPSGTTVAVSPTNAAGEVLLTSQDGSGRYGEPGSGIIGDIIIPGHAVKLLPTASGQERCFLTLRFTPVAGIPLTVDCDAPRMETGRSYTLDLDYTKLKPCIYISSGSISPWEDGWTVSGEVLNPQN